MARIFPQDEAKVFHVPETLFEAMPAQGELGNVNDLGSVDLSPFEGTITFDRGPRDRADELSLRLMELKNQEQVLKAEMERVETLLLSAQEARMAQGWVDQPSLWGDVALWDDMRAWKKGL